MCKSVVGSKNKKPRMINARSHQRKVMKIGSERWERMIITQGLAGCRKE